MAETKVLVLLPRLPNFLKAGSGSIDVANLSDDTLRQIGAEWTAALLEHAKKRREGKREGVEK